MDNGPLRSFLGTARTSSQCRSDYYILPNWDLSEMGLGRNRLGCWPQSDAESRGPSEEGLKKRSFPRDTPLAFSFINHIALITSIISNPKGPLIGQPLIELLLLDSIAPLIVCKPAQCLLPPL